MASRAREGKHGYRGRGILSARGSAREGRRVAVMAMRANTGSRPGTAVPLRATAVSVPLEVWAGHATGSAKQLALGGAARAMASPPRTRSFLRLRLGGGHVEPAGSGQVLAAEPPAEIWPRLISAL